MSTSAFKSAQEHLNDPSKWFDGYINALTSTSRYAGIIGKLGDARKEVKATLNAVTQTPLGQHLDSAQEEFLKVRVREKHGAGIGLNLSDQLDGSLALDYVQREIQSHVHRAGNLVEEALTSRFKAICQAGAGATEGPHIQCKTDLEHVYWVVNNHCETKGAKWMLKAGVLNLVKDIGIEDSDSSLTNRIKKAFQMLVAARLAVAKLVLLCQEMRDIDIERVQGV